MAAALRAQERAPKIDRPALGAAFAMGDCEQDDSDDSDGAAYFHRMRPLSGATLVPEIDKQIVYARAEIMNTVQEFIVNEGMSSKRRNTYLDFSLGNRDMMKSFQVLDKYYCYMHLFELHCGINWREIWRIVWIDDPAIKDNMFRDMALVGLSSTSEDGFLDIEYRSMSDVDRVSNLIIRYYKERVLPFFDKWSDYRSVKEEFFALSDSAKNISLFPSRASRIAIAIALVDGDRELALKLIAEHGLYFKSEPSGMQKMERFVETLRARGLV